MRAASVAVGRSAAAQFAEEVGCAPSMSWPVRLAVSEALSNAVLHAHRDEDEPPEIGLLAEHADGILTLTVTDHGSGMRPRPDSPGMGAGLRIITGCCDRLELGEPPGGGTVVRMVFALGSSGDPQPEPGAVTREPPGTP